MLLFKQILKRSVPVVSQFYGCNEFMLYIVDLPGSLREGFLTIPNKTFP